MTDNILILQEWDEKIRAIVDRFGLKCYPQEFEICDHNEMIGYMAYSGMPSHYSHWSFGKQYEKQKTFYDYGVSGLPYEMVINSNPCLAYLMRDNNLPLQILTMAHVYGHNDFFANNFTFKSAFDAHYTLEMFKMHASRIDSYIEDPSIGLEEVEKVFDSAHSIAMQCSKNLGVKQLGQEELRLRKWEQAQDVPDPYWEIHPKRLYQAPDLNKLPLEPVEDILSFIADNNPYLPEWKRDLLHIVAIETRYFIPQMETKIMNEGWASLWHFRILHELGLPANLHLEFLVKHSQVLRPTPGGLNPYHLGYIIWQDIEKRWNEGRTGREFSDDKPFDLEKANAQTVSPGLAKIFEVRETDRDTSFLRRFLTVDIIRELDLFQHEMRGKERVVTKVADEENWQEIKDTLIRNAGAGSVPVIKVVDADFERKRTLYLKHFHDGRDLKLDYAERTLRYVQDLWERDVVMETIINTKESLLRFEEGRLKIDRL